MKKKIKIMHIQDSLNIGGMENGIINIANSLDPDIFESQMCCLTDRGAFADRLDPDKTKVYVMNQNDGIKIKHFLEIKELLINHSIDIVHTHNFAAGFKGIIAAYLAKIPAVIHGEHGSIQWEFALRRRFLSYLLSKFTDKIIYVSQGLEDYCTKKLFYPKKKGKVIINGVDDNRFRKKNNIEFKKKEFGLKSDTFVIGMVGRLVPFKNHKFVLQVLSKIKKDIDDVILILVGDGRERNKLEKMCDQLGIQNSVILTGNRSDMDDIYSIFDIFVLPSFNGEGTSNVILEAMITGIPVLASDVPGNNKLIYNSENGFLFDPTNLSQLESLVRDFIKDASLKKSFGLKAKEYAKKHFVFKTMVESYSKIYLDLYKRNL